MNLGHVFEQGDAVLIAVFLSLVLMSIITWCIILIRSINLLRAKRSNKQAQIAIWNSISLQEA